MNAPKKVVYMADDDDDDRYFMRRSFLEVDPSVTIVEAQDGSALLALLDTWSQESLSPPVHLILLDMNMPRMNGLETLTAIKAHPSLRHIPTVMMSTSAEPDQVATAYQSGVNGYIKKSACSSTRICIAQALSVCYLNAMID